MAGDSGGRKKKKAEEDAARDAKIAELEQRIVALEDAARAFAVVYAVPRLPDPEG